MGITTLKVRLYGDPCLRMPAKPIEEVGASERMLIQLMVNTMKQQEGIGLAAPQVGVSQRIFVVDIGDGLVAMVNPEIFKRSGTLSVLEEGCLSIPEVLIKITRPERIWVRYLDENNQKIEEECSGLMARVVQHENDHLDGRLITDYATDMEKEKYRMRLDDYQQQRHHE